MARSRSALSCASSSNSDCREPSRPLARQTLRVMFARSSSSGRKLCSGVPSSARRVAFRRFALAGGSKLNLPAALLQQGCDKPSPNAHYPQGLLSCLFEKLLCTAADVTLDPTRCLIALKKQRNLPALLETLDQLPAEPLPWLGNRHLVSSGATRC